MYIDVHAHLTDKAFANVNAAMAQIKNAGVGLVICSGYDMQSSYAARDLAEQYGFVYFSAGFQPQELGKYKEGDLEKLRQLVRHPKCLAVGEIGLDYHYEDNPPKPLQQTLFQSQIRLAHEEGLPVVIHSRDCAEDMLQILRQNQAYLGHGGVLHCYSHSAEQSVEFEKLGLYFSFGGTATYETARKVKRSAATVSLQRILTETDSPYLTPVPKRGQFPNTPANVVYVAKQLATIKGVPLNDFLLQVEQNARRLFTKLPPNV